MTMQFLIVLTMLVISVGLFAAIREHDLRLARKIETARLAQIKRITLY